MANERTMTCPDCGVEMNRHAEKISYAEGLATPEAADPRTGGVLEEFHTCPVCGKAHARRAEDDLAA